jgi:hypothetical protein
MTGMDGALGETSEVRKGETMRLQGDLLHGADAIAAFVFGDAKKRRRIYQLADTTSFPIFRLGTTLCARKSKLLAWIARQEAQAIEKH